MMNQGNLKFKTVINRNWQTTIAKPSVQLKDEAQDVYRQPTPLHVYQPEQQIFSPQQQKYMDIKRFEQYMCNDGQKYNQFCLNQQQREQFIKLLEDQLTSYQNSTLQSKFVTNLPTIKTRSHTFNQNGTMNSTIRQTYSFVTPARYVLYKNQNVNMGLTKLNPLYNAQNQNEDIKKARNQLVQNAWNTIKTSNIVYPKVTHDNEEKLISPEERSHNFYEQIKQIQNYHQMKKELDLKQKRQRILTSEYLSVPDLHDAIEKIDTISKEQKEQIQLCNPKCQGKKQYFDDPYNPLSSNNMKLVLNSDRVYNIQSLSAAQTISTKNENVKAIKEKAINNTVNLNDSFTRLFGEQDLRPNNIVLVKRRNERKELLQLNENRGKNYDIITHVIPPKL